MKKYQCELCNTEFPEHDDFGVECLQQKKHILCQLCRNKTKDELKAWENSNSIKKVNFLGQYCYKKTGAVYNVIGKVRNCTNSQDGQMMIVYSRDGEEYVREESEFFEKFVKLKFEEPKPDTLISRKGI